MAVVLRKCSNIELLLHNVTEIFLPVSITDQTLLETNISMTQITE